MSAGSPGQDRGPADPSGVPSALTSALLERWGVFEGLLLGASLFVEVGAV
jgi:hypothetical protein